MNVRRAAKPDSIKLTVHNRDEVCALLDSSLAATTGPSPMGASYIAVTITNIWNSETDASIVVPGDTIVTTETGFAIHVDDQVNVTPRSVVPRYLMPDNEAHWIREVVWTPGIRRKHAEGYGFRTHRCSCQYGTSWQCGDGQLHHKCIYGRDSAMWQLASPECVITWPDGRDAEFAEPIRSYTYNQGKTWHDHRAIVWLADRTCRCGCACDCHADVMSRPPAPMNDEAAAWVREFVWTNRMRKAFADTPGAYQHCACQAGPSGHCNADRHTKCWHADNEPQRSPEAYVCGTDGTSVLMFAEPFTHPTGSATGAKRTSHAQVWLADRACRWRCPCDCHTGAPVTPEPPPAAEPPIDKPVQLDLFDVLAS